MKPAPKDVPTDVVSVEVPAAVAVLDVVAVEYVPLALVEDADPIHTVMPWDDDGWAQLVMRGIGYGDATLYDEDAVAVVEELQLQNGLEPTGIVSGETWAYVLCDITPNSSGIEVGILRRLLGLSQAGTWDALVSERLGAIGLDDTLVNSGCWLDLIKNGPVA